MLYNTYILSEKSPEGNTSISLIPKLGKDIKIRDNYRPYLSQPWTQISF